MDNLDMDKIVLLSPEALLLWKYRLRKKVHINDAAPHESLKRKKMIEVNYLSERNQNGAKLPDGTASITDFGKRFVKKSVTDFLHRVFTPVVVSVLTNLAIHLLKVALG